jgi:hypothetical protein
VAALSTVKNINPRGLAHYYHRAQCQGILDFPKLQIAMQDRSKQHAQETSVS